MFVISILSGFELIQFDITNRVFIDAGRYTLLGYGLIAFSLPVAISNLASKYKLNVDRPKLKPVEEYLKPQGRYRHLPKEEIEKIQEKVNQEYTKLKAKVSASAT